MYQAKREYDHQVGTLTAIVMDKQNGKAVGKKYRNIKDNEAATTRFCAFAKSKFPNATHVNFYEKAGKLFRVQVPLTTGDRR
jgi:hypothetical protein